jgi:7-carboxy-7-deazaguanine synthase
MFISEIFHSIQGEGSLMGTPSVFVRTSGCNLRCNWCDTRHTSWEPEGEHLSVDDVLDRVLTHSARHGVLTGGEPMLAPDLPEVAGRLRAAGQHITIETAATLPPDGIACDLASLSPKLRHSRPDDRLPPAWRERHEQRRLRPDVIADWVRRYPYQLKFVVSRPEDLVEIQALLETVPAPVTPDRVFLMPEGTDAETLKERGTWLSALCLRHGYRFSRRLHIELFGHLRGT